MKTKNRVISLLLVACMMLSLCAALPFVASAEVVSTSGWDGKTGYPTRRVGNERRPVSDCGCGKPLVASETDSGGG